MIEVAKRTNEQIEKAKRRGHEERMKQGIKQEKIEIAKKMLNANVEIEQIIEFTGLSKEEIKKM